MPKTGFRPEIDGFGFINDWDMTPDDFNQLRGLIESAITAVSWTPLVLPLLPVPPPFGPLIMGKAITDAIGAQRFDNYGLCGGMALAALDYYKRGWVPPRGCFNGEYRRPEWSSPAGAAIRKYIWGRLLDTLRADGITCILWMGVLKGVIPLGGAGWLRDRTREEFGKIKQRIDAGEPCPVGLVGTTGTPGNNHQVLAYGYEDPDNGTGKLYVYEPNGPNQEQTITFDLRGDMLKASESCYATGGPENSARDADGNWYSPEKGPLRGFYAESYTFQEPPIAVGVTAGLASSPASSVNVNNDAVLRFTAKNLGWGDSPPLKLFVAGRVSLTGQNVDPGGEAAAAILPAGGSREIVKTTRVAGALGPRHFFTSSSVEVGTAQGWRLLPRLDPGAHDAIDLTVAAVQAAWESLGGWIITPPTVTRNGDGRLEVFAIGTDNRLYHLWQTAPNNGWTGWTVMGTTRVAGCPAIIHGPNGKMEIFMRGADRQLWHIWKDSSTGGWGNWDCLGGQWDSDPAAIANADGRAEVFIRGGDTLQHRWQMPGGAWLAWFEPLGSGLAGNPTVGKNRDGRLEVFTLRANGEPWHRWQVSPGGAFADGAGLGGVGSADPVVAANADGRLELFMRGTDGALWHNAELAAGGWSGWSSTGTGSLAPHARPSIVLDRAGRLDVFARFADNTVRHKPQTAPGAMTYADWISLAGPVDSDPSADLNLDGRAEVFARGVDTQLRHRWQVSPGGGYNP